MGGRDSRADAALEQLDPGQVPQDPFERLDVAELRIDVEQVPLDDAGNAVTDGLADDDRT